MEIPQHWLKEYLPELPNSKIEDIRNNKEFKINIISQLAQALGAEFYQYVEVPSGYSTKTTVKWSFFSKGSDQPILFLPNHIYELLGQSKERQICELFDVRIKYVSEPVQL